MKMIRMHASDFIRSLAASGRYSFTSDEARKALGVSAVAAKLALHRLIRAGEVGSPARGFYVTVTPEYRSLGCLPADQFIPALMERAGQPYYVGLLSAAQYHGAAHHRPQEFQVMLAKPRRPIECGQVRVAFFVRKDLKDVSVQSFNTPRGAIQASTPEATALDLIGYQHHAGGLDQVVTIISELAERIAPEKLAAAAAFVPLPWAQRLGYILDQVGAADKASALKAHVASSARQVVPLLPAASVKDSRRDDGWKLVINAEVEPES